MAYSVDFLVGTAHHKEIGFVFIRVEPYTIRSLVVGELGDALSY